MSFRKVWKCDICREETLEANIRGCNFSGMREFKLGVAQSTDGVHICIGCLQQIADQLPHMGKNFTPLR